MTVTLPDVSVSDAADRPFKRVGGQLVLDFLDTTGWYAADGERRPIARYERLDRYDRLLQFVAEVGVLSATLTGQLAQRATEDPDEAGAVLDRALRLRSALHWAIIDTIEGRSPDPRDLRTVDAELHRTLSHLHLREGEGAFAWSWEPPDWLERVLWPIVRDAADLLTSPDFRRVRLCAGDDCGFLFLDTSPNRTRRWCVMQDCGNRAKARRHYHRTRGD